MTTIRRRTFAPGLLAPFAATAQSEAPPPAVLKKFSEVSASLYAWDLLDEGCDAILDALAETTGADSAYLVALMHHEKRPLTGFLLSTRCPSQNIFSGRQPALLASSSRSIPRHEDQAAR